ncbi:hypothetical protein SUDANB5_00047 [Streptomyces sp. SudanB5_2050]
MGNLGAVELAIIPGFLLIIVVSVAAINYTVRRPNKG